MNKKWPHAHTTFENRDQDIDHLFKLEYLMHVEDYYFNMIYSLQLIERSVLMQHFQIEQFIC